MRRLAFLVALNYHEQGATLNHISQPRGRVLMHDVRPLAPGVRPGDDMRPGGCGRVLHHYLVHPHQERVETRQGCDFLARRSV